MTFKSIYMSDYIIPLNGVLKNLVSFMSLNCWKSNF